MPNYKDFLSVPHLIFLPIHVCVLLIPFVSTICWLHICYFLIGYVLICGLGNNVGLHRWASHKSVELGKYSKYVVLFFSMMAGQGHPVWWAALHRGQHHRNSDTETDSHSPIHGKWHAFHGWVWKYDPLNVSYKYVTDLMRDPLMIFTFKYYKSIVITVWIIIGLVDTDLLLWMFMLPAMLSLHLEGMVNLFCHIKLGYRNFDTKDNSHNVPLLGILNWGNGWHNNHHYNQSSFDFGSGISKNWYEFDPCKMFLPLLKY
jgi:stearoyl-CoA desaturase (delta-9 desaturase)